MTARSVYITGANAGLGHALAQVFSQRGDRVGLIARGEDGLRQTAAVLPTESAWAIADVGNCDELAAAAKDIAATIGPPDIWINNAMATVFSRFADITAEEFARATRTTYLGSVHGLMVALQWMQPRGRGQVIQIGSALAYRPIPLQAPYCGAKLAIRGVLNSLRSELIHDGSPLDLTMVHMPAMNTPQFEWARRHIPQQPQPVPPIYAPAACAQAVHWAAQHPHMREVWVGKATALAILGNKVLPAFMDRYMASHAYEDQFDGQGETADGNLFEPVPTGHRAEGRFSDRQRPDVIWFGTSERREWLAVAAVTAIVVLLALLLIAL